LCSHQLISSSRQKPQGGAQNDLYRTEALADLSNDALDLLTRTGRSIDVRTAQLRAQEMLAREDVQRQVAIAIVIAVVFGPATKS
jgi:hypothetical protein